MFHQCLHWLEWEKLYFRSPSGQWLARLMGPASEEEELGPEDMVILVRLGEGRPTGDGIEVNRPYIYIYRTAKLEEVLDEHNDLKEAF